MNIFESRRVTVLALVALLAISTFVAPVAAQRFYSDAELEVMPAPGPNPFLSFLPADAVVDWDYWNAKADYEGRKRAAAQAAARGETDGGSVAEIEPNDSLATAQVISGFGTGAGDDASIDVTGTVDAGGDIDCFEIDLEIGDTLGVAQSGSPGLVEIFEPGGELNMGSTRDASFLYPASSPLPGGGNVADHVTYVDGGHFVCAPARGPTPCSW